MPRFAPFVQHTGNELIRTNPDIRGSIDEIMGSPIIQIGELVGGIRES